MENNSRVGMENGFKFYEQDILYDNHIYTKDVEITVDVTYTSAGFGIALISCLGEEIEEKGDSYLFKIGYKEASAHFASSDERKVLKQINCLEASTIQENLKFRLKKIGKKISIDLNGKTVLEEYISKNMDKFNVGFYSSAGNVINHINVISNIPNGWTVNMIETEGGHISFIKDGFEISKCKNFAEIEQSNMFLKKGMYYLNYEREDIFSKNDIDCYVFKSDEDLTVSLDSRYYDEKKNILNKTNGIFVLREDSYVNIKFKGTCGIVKKIMISNDKNNSYISTSESPIAFKGSYIDVILTDVSKVIWEGKISRTPSTLNNNIFGIILDKKTQIRPSMAGVSFNQKYYYEFSTEDYQLKIKKNGIQIHKDGEHILRNLENKITIFKNMTSEITKLKLIKKDGSEIDVTLQDQNHIVVSGNINSPIIVVDEYDVPFDLSSSYRLCKYDTHSEYVFTNWEREIFDPNTILKLEKRILKQQDTVIVYGILREGNIENIFNVCDGNINSIDEYTRNYEQINISDIEHIDKITSTIYIDKDIVSKYSKIVVDYLKAESYCINYSYKNNTYRVDVSSTENNNRILYNSNVENGIVNIEDYKITGIKENINSYIVLRKGW